MLNETTQKQMLEMIRCQTDEWKSFTQILKMIKPFLTENKMSVDNNSVVNWLKAQGYLENSTTPSEAGRLLGIETMVMKIREVPRHFLGYNLAAQEFIVEHLNDIYAPIEQSKIEKEAAKAAEKAVAKAEKEAAKAKEKDQRELERKASVKDGLLKSHEQFIPIEEQGPISLTHLRKRINECLGLPKDQQMSRKDIADVLVEEGWLVKVDNREVVSDKGRSKGIVMVDGVNAEGEAYTIPKYDAKAQQAVVDIMVKQYKQ